MSAPADVVLLYPPLTDPTSGYHSLSYLDAYARSEGLPAATIIDANIGSFHHTLDAEVADRLLTEVAAVRESLLAGRLPSLSGPRAMAVLAASRTGPDEVRQAARVLRDPEDFYDYRRYRRAVECVCAWMSTISCAGIPGSFTDGFRLELDGVVDTSSIERLTDPAFLRRLNRPFEDYYRDVLLPRLAGADIVGVNITYESQLPFALAILAGIPARAHGGPLVVVGGTDVADVWKYLTDRSRLFDLFPTVDCAVVGEGESAWAGLLRSWQDSGGFELAVHPNVVHRRCTMAAEAPPLYEQVRALPTPSFEALPWPRYLAPEPFVYYSPTRGCYWNKCTFCDYGLNFESPTSPWRQSPVDKMIEDARLIAEEARFLYLSVDVLAPAAMLAFAQRLCAEDIDIRWGAEIRLEKYWSAERCQILRDSGCVAVSVGFESASQRILDLIDKGTRPEQVAATIRALTEAGIGVQMMGFTGFPGETEAEALQSVEFLLDNRDHWVIAGLGEFVLTAGAVVARQPDRFGITGVRPRDGGEIARALCYDDPVGDAVNRQAVREAKQALRSMDFDRPWLGGIDTPHTFLYLDRYGSGLLDELHRPVTGTLRVNGTVCTVPDAIRPAGTPKRIFLRTDGRAFPFPDVLLTALDAMGGGTAFVECLADAGVTDAETQEKIRQRLSRQHVLRGE